MGDGHGEHGGRGGVTGRAPGVRHARRLSVVAVDEHLDAQVDLGLQPRTTGKTVASDLVTGDILTLLTLNYYTCETLFAPLNAVLEGLKGSIILGEEFRVVTVSIDPNEDAKLARSKREPTRVFGQGSQWHFLTGDQAAIASFAETVARYSYDESTGNMPILRLCRSCRPKVGSPGTSARSTERDLKFAPAESQLGEWEALQKLILGCFRHTEPWRCLFAFE